MTRQATPIRTITFDYDAASQLKEVSDEDSTYKYTYDDGGRLILVDNAGTPGVPNVVLEYAYDEVNNLLDVTETIDGEASGIESFVYNELNRVIQTTQTGTGVTDKRVDFEYDNASRMTEVISCPDD
ncbi:MAG: RHS repeat domain-containing protein [Cyanobacteriota bacterium]|nr:RHS repeat domain-containing protein [Cyanobacteriota bacterium]